jgi:nucleotide-binding universal stress UspA family protein
MGPELKPTKQKKGSKTNLSTRAKSNGSLIWALDSVTLTDEKVEKFQQVLAFLKRDHDGIIPATIFSPFDLGWLAPLDNKFKKKTAKRLEIETKKLWESFSFKSKNAGFLISESNSNRDKALALIHFATRKKAKIIVIGAKVKTKNSLSEIGSFAENLISLSPIPVLVIGEAVVKIRPISKILFPTDFSEVSKKTFQKVIKFAKEYKAEIILYHFLNLEAGPLVYGIPWGFEIKWLDNFWRDQEQLKQKEGEIWKFRAEKQNVKCQFVCDRKVGRLSERIVTVARNYQVDLLAVTVKRGPWSQVILGGQIRELFGHSTCPVLAIHTNLKNKKSI